MGKYIVLDIVFYASSLNYDWGGGTNYQELKKITKWDGRQYVLVSRYALRYSILHWANKMFPNEWKLAGQDVLIAPEEGVARLKSKEEIDKKKYESYKNFLEEVFRQYPEFDLFGFMVAKEKRGEKGEQALTRVSPVKISHAISLTPTNLDAHTMANLDIVKRAGGKGSNPVTIEEKSDFYVYNITVDVERIGKYLKEEHGDDSIGDIKINDNTAKNRIIQLIETVLNLKRDIKGRREDLSPWLMIVGLYEDGKYETFIDKIILERKTRYKVIRKNKPIEENGRIIGEEIENEIEEGLMPLFRISADEVTGQLPLYYRKGFCDYEPKDNSKFKTLNSKREVLKAIKCFLNGTPSNECGKNNEEE